MKIDLQPDGAIVDGALIPLTPNEQALLSWLVDHPGTPQSRDTLLTHVWGYRTGVHSRTVDSTMNRLRAKLGAGRATIAIWTVRGQGWVFDPSGTGEESPFVGRTEDREAVERWLGGGGALLTVTGEPGIGKSTLIGRSVSDRVIRVDAAEIRSADDWFRMIEAGSRGRPRRVSWLDGADRLVDLLRTLLPARLEHRLVVTCRRPLHHPAEEVRRVGPLDEAQASSLGAILAARWFPGAIWKEDELARRVGRCDGNPLAIELAIRDREDGASRVGLDRSLDGLPAGGRGALERLLAVPVAVPHELAVQLAGAEGVLRDLAERSLIVEVAFGWRVPAVVRIGLETSPAVEAAVARWVVDRVERVRRSGDARWLAFLRGLEPELPLLQWVAMEASDPEAVGASVLALDDHRRLFPRLDLQPFHDRAVEVGVPEALLRRSSWRLRHGDGVGAEADRDAHLQSLGSRVEDVPRARAMLGEAFAAYGAGEIARAEELAVSVLACGERVGDHVLEAMARFVLAQAALWRGDTRGALAAARAARTVPVNIDRAGHTVTSFLGRYLHEAGHDDEAREALAESRRIASAIGFHEGTVFSDGVLAWIDVVTVGDRAAVDRLGTVCGTLGELDSHYQRGTRLRYAWAQIVAGAAERGLSELRAVTSELLAVGTRVDAAHGRAFAIAGRVRLGLGPHAPWMASDGLEGDPVVRELVRGLEANASGDEATARAIHDRYPDVTSGRARALRRVLADLLAARALSPGVGRR